MPIDPRRVTSAITHEMVEETDLLPVFFSSPGRSARPGGCQYSRDGLTIPVHWHEYMEFIWMREGHMTAVVHADTYELGPGDLLVINCQELHMTRVDTYMPRSPYVLIQMSAKRLREYFPELELLHFTTFLSAREVEASPGLRDALQNMQEIFEAGEEGYQLLFTAWLYRFLYELYRSHSSWSVSRTDATAGRDLGRITEIVEWTRENFRKPLTLDDAAGHLGLSREYFCRMFKKYTGQTYLEYLCATRTMNLYEELQTSDQNLPILMEQNGLKNYKTFIRTFKELYGTTPQKARKRVG